MQFPEVRAARSWRWLAIYLGLAGFAITQPALGVLGENPILVTQTNVSDAFVVAFALVTALAPAILLWLVDVALPSPARAVFRAVACFGLVALFAGRLFTLAGLDGALLVVIGALVAAVAVTWFLLTKVQVRQAMMFTAVLPVLAIATLFMSSETGELVRAGPVAAVEISAEEVAELAPVVVLIVDELPTTTLLDDDAMIDGSRFPNLARLSEQATWYRNFTTVSPFTESAVPALLTGQNPTGDAPLWTNYPDSLFRLLAGSYHLAVIESNNRLCAFEPCGQMLQPPPPIGPAPTRVAPVEQSSDGVRFVRTLSRLWWEGVITPSEPAGLDDFAETVTTEPPVETTPEIATPGTLEPLTTEGFNFLRAIGSGTRGQPERFTEWVNTMTASDTPALWFAHLALPHQPFTFSPTGVQFAEPVGPHGLADPVNSNPHVSAVRRQLHVQQTRYTDALIGQMLAQLEQAGIYDRATIVIVADHGMNFAADTHDREYADATAQAIAYAPLLVKAPGQSVGVVSDQNVMSVDLLPLIADSIGVTIPWAVDGVVPGSTAAAERGDEKYIYDYVDAFRSQLRGIATFGDRSDLVAQDAVELLDYEPPVQVGQPFAPLSQSSRRAALANLDEVGLPVGVVAGTLDGPATEVVVAIGDTIVGVSPVTKYRDLDNYFVVMVDVEQFDSRVELIRVGIVQADGSIAEAVVDNLP